MEEAGSDAFVYCPFDVLDSPENRMPAWLQQQTSRQELAGRRKELKKALGGIGKRICFMLFGLAIGIFFLDLNVPAKLFPISIALGCLGFFLAFFVIIRGSRAQYRVAGHKCAEFNTRDQCRLRWSVITVKRLAFDGYDWSLGISISPIST